MTIKHCLIITNLLFYEVILYFRNKVKHCPNLDYDNTLHISQKNFVFLRKFLNFCLQMGLKTWGVKLYITAQEHKICRKYVK